MYSRAHLLIEREYKKLLADPPWGIEIWPLYDDRVFEWMAKIRGLKNTLWEGGVFRIYIQFDEHYNIRPPRIVFQTIPFHPNVNMSTGQPCVDFLNDYSTWNEDYSLSMMLVSLQTLLLNPVCENAVNQEAAHMLTSNPELYNKMIRECVANSQKIEAGSDLQVLLAGSRAGFNNQVTPSQPCTASLKADLNRVIKLSFEDYHKTWLGIATSKTTPEDINPLLEKIRDNQVLQKIHLGLSKAETEELSRKQAEAHDMLLYGQFKDRQSKETEKAAKLAQLDRMKQIYLPPRQSPSTPKDGSNREKTLTEPRIKDKHDLWEDEVDDLVKWSHDLDSNALGHI